MSSSCADHWSLGVAPAAVGSMALITSRTLASQSPRVSMGEKSMGKNETAAGSNLMARMWDLTGLGTRSDAMLSRLENVPRYTSAPLKMRMPSNVYSGMQATHRRSRRSSGFLAQASCSRMPARTCRGRCSCAP